MKCNFGHVAVKRIAALCADLKLAVLDIIDQMSIWAYQCLFERCWEDVDSLRCRIIYHTRVTGWFIPSDSDAVMQSNNYCSISIILTDTHMQIQMHAGVYGCSSTIDNISLVNFKKRNTLKTVFTLSHSFNWSINNVDMHHSRILFLYFLFSSECHEKSHHILWWKWHWWKWHFEDICKTKDTAVLF